MAAPAPTPKLGAKGLPLWAWGAAAAAGLVIGLVFLRKADAATAAPGDSAASPASQSAAESSPPGGVVALPPELLEALGVRALGSAYSTPSVASGDTAVAVSSAGSPTPAPQPLPTNTGNLTLAQARALGINFTFQGDVAGARTVAAPSSGSGASGAGKTFAV